MRYKIADLIVEIPKVGGLAPHFREYIYEGAENPQVMIDPGKYNADKYQDKLNEDSLAYLESGKQFFSALIVNNGIYLHSSSVTYQGKGYLFSAPCGTGKSTHTKIWNKTFGQDAKIFNDDKTPLRCLDGVWYAYGAPWCGKDNININMRVPVAGICFLKQASENRICRLTPGEAATRIISQTIRKYKDVERLDLMLSHVDKLAREIPVFELENRPEPEAAMLSYDTMRRAAEEMGL